MRHGRPVHPRWFQALLWGFGVGACGGEAPCSTEACEAVCDDIQAAQQAAVPEGGTRLTAYEFDRLYAPFRAVREVSTWGVQLSLSLCRRPDCTTPLVTDPMPLLEPGAYELQVETQVPAAGAIELQYRRRCLTSDGQTIADLERTVPLPASSGDAPVRTSLEVFGVPAQGDLAGAVRCRFAVFGHADPARAPTHQYIDVRLDR